MGGDRRARHHCGDLLALSLASHGNSALMPHGGHLLSVLIFFPAVCSLALLMLRAEDHEWIRRLTLGISAIEFIFSLFLLRNLPVGPSGYRAEEFFRWINVPP